MAGFCQVCDFGHLCTDYLGSGLALELYVHMRIGPNLLEDYVHNALIV